MAEQTGVVKYQARDGQEITLTVDTIKKYLVQGNRDAVTGQEIMYFLGICKSRGLNPFKKDAYLIKYGSDPAAIVTSIDYFRSRAKAQKDCRGWKRGLIVQKEDGTLRDSAGLVLDGEKLVGGFFEAKPVGWDDAFRLEVNLSGYIKKTKEGKTTRFWQPENQPTMIAKVAEGQGLRTLWPDEFQGIYEESEVTTNDSRPIDMSRIGNGASFEMASNFDSTIPEGTDLAMLDKFLTTCAESFKRSIEEVKIEAAKEPETFWPQFEKWAKAQGRSESGPKPDNNTDTAKEFANLTGMLLSRFSGLHDKGIREFADTHKAAIPSWPESIQKIVYDKFAKKPEWKALLEETQPETEPLPHITEKEDTEKEWNGLIQCDTYGPVAKVRCDGCKYRKDEQGVICPDFESQRPITTGSKQADPM